MHEVSTTKQDARAASLRTATKDVVVGLRRVVRDSAWIVMVSAVLGVSTNALRKDKLPLIARNNYEIMVPCPEPLGAAEAISATDPRVTAVTSLVIDARSRDEFAAWHVPTATNVPFDWLAEQDQINKDVQAVARNVARSGKHAVVIYGDGGEPDSGHQWAALLNLAGIRNVTYVAGGSVALRGATSTKVQP